MELDRRYFYLPQYEIYLVSFTSKAEVHLFVVALIVLLKTFYNSRHNMFSVDNIDRRLSVTYRRLILRTQNQ